MKPDIVAELRECHCFACRDQGAESVHQRAAAEIESLRKEWAEGVCRVLEKVKTNESILNEATQRLDKAGL